MTDINTKTSLTGIIGYPLDKTLSPLIQNAAFESIGLNWCYVPLRVKPDNLEVAIHGLPRLGFRGINVTMPHKQGVMQFVDEVSSFAELAGAVNTIDFQDSKIIGYNTDGRGFLDALEQDADFKPEGKRAVVLGAGGAGRSIALILALNKVESLVVVNRTPEKAKDLVVSIGKKFGDCNLSASSFNDNLPKIIDSADLVVNSTPVGWNGELVVDPDLFRAGQMVVDLVYIPEETKLLHEAKSRGANILSGKLMLLYQGAAAFEIWTKTQAPLEEMRKALDKMLSTA